MNLRIVTLIGLLLVFQGNAATQNKNEGYLGIFETIWQKVNETYFDPTFGGSDWKKVHDSYQPQIASAKNDGDFHALINKMLWELKVSHMAYIPPGFFAAVEPVREMLLKGIDSQLDAALKYLKKERQKES